MKVKLKLDANSIQQALVDHAEKALFAVVVLGCLFFVYRAIAREQPIKFAPEELSQKAKRAEEHLQATDAKPPQVPDYKKVAEEIAAAMPDANLNLYSVETRINPPIIPTPRPRSKPALFPLKDVRGMAGNGAFSVAQTSIAARDTGGMGAKGFRWVVITGLIDWKAQVDAYRMVFADTQPIDQQLDPPEYATYILQRAEVNSLDQGPIPESRWQRVYFNRQVEMIGTETARGAGSVTTDPVSPAYSGDSALSAKATVRFMFPLPPLVGRAWGPEITHPGIPIRDPGEMGLIQREPSPDAPPQPGTEGAALPLAKLPANSATAEDPDAPLARGVAGESGQRGEPAADSRQRGTGSRSRATGRGLASLPGRDVAGTAAREEPQYLLFRFFDFGVQPGKSYRYRVKLVLDNPNYSLPPQYVERDDLRVAPFLETEWSVPTAAALVPLDSRTLAAPPKPREPAGTTSLLVIHLDAGTGMEAYHEVTASRGQWLNYLNQTFQPATEGMGGGGPSLPRAPVAPANGQPMQVNYETEAILLDFAGGAVLPGKDKDLLEPRTMLVADKSGNIFVRNELDDRADYERFLPPTPTLGGPTRPGLSPETTPRGRTKAPVGVEGDMMDRGKTKRGKAG